MKVFIVLETKQRDGYHWSDTNVYKVFSNQEDADSTAFVLNQQCKLSNEETTYRYYYEVVVSDVQ